MTRSPSPRAAAQVLYRLLGRHRLHFLVRLRFPAQPLAQLGRHRDHRMHLLFDRLQLLLDRHGLRLLGRRRMPLRMARRPRIDEGFPVAKHVVRIEAVRVHASFGFGAPIDP